MGDRSSTPAPVRITVRYYAAARAAAGLPEESVRVGPGSTVADVIAAAVDNHGPELARVLERCSFLLDETAVHTGATAVRDGSRIDVLPPFAGG